MRRAHVIAIAVAAGFAGAAAIGLWLLTPPTEPMEVSLPSGTRVVRSHGNITIEGINRTWEITSDRLTMEELSRYYEGELPKHGYTVFYSYGTIGDRPGRVLGAGKGAGEYGVEFRFWNVAGQTCPTHAEIQHSEYFLD